MLFAIARLMKAFRFLPYGLAALLILVGSKMLAADYYRVPIGITLGVVAGVLLISIVASVAIPATNAK
jgi:tellurite resistance protein TerC